MTFLNEPEFFLHIVKWFYILLYISHFNISHLFAYCSIRPIDRTLTGATAPDQSRPENNSNEKVLHIPQNSSITEATPSDCLVSYLGYFGVCGGGFLPLQKCSLCILQPQPTGPCVQSNSSIWPIDRTLSGTTTPGQGGPKSNGNERIRHISQISKALPSNGLISHAGHLCVCVCVCVCLPPSTAVQLVYSTAQDNWAAYREQLLESI